MGCKRSFLVRDGGMTLRDEHVLPTNPTPSIVEAAIMGCAVSINFWMAEIASG